MMPLGIDIEPRSDDERELLSVVKRANRLRARRMNLEVELSRTILREEQQRARRLDVEKRCTTAHVTYVRDETGTGWLSMQLDDDKENSK